MTNGGGITLGWGKLVTLVLVLMIGYGGTIYTAFAQQNQKESMVEIKEQQEKKHDKIDIKFEKMLAQMTTTNKDVMAEISKTNIALAEAVAVFKERTK
jgi:hypothetical protein